MLAASRPAFALASLFCAVGVVALRKLDIDDMEACFGDPEVKVILEVACSEHHEDGHRQFITRWNIKGYVPCSYEITEEDWTRPYFKGVDDRILGNTMMRHEADSTVVTWWRP